MPVESLYTAYLIQAGKDTRFTGTLSGADIHTKSGNNPLCGDKITWHLKLLDDNTVEIRFETTGCLISKASASFLAALMQGKSEKEFWSYLEMLKTITEQSSTDPEPKQLEEAPWLSLAQIKSYPTRKKCVFLAWDTLTGLLKSIPESLK
jgi:nitrogen fixation NifU-like protein